jgi:hypothetical protein
VHAIVPLCLCFEEVDERSALVNGITSADDLVEGLDVSGAAFVFRVVVMVVAVTLAEVGMEGDEGAELGVSAGFEVDVT